MKSQICLLAVAAGAATSALLASSHPVASGLLFTAIGTVSILAVDYGRRVLPLSTSAPLIEFPRGGRQAPALPRAA